jgi:hypothetical protein
MQVFVRPLQATPIGVWGIVVVAVFYKQATPPGFGHLFSGRFCDGYTVV